MNGVGQKADGVLGDLFFDDVHVCCLGRCMVLLFFVELFKKSKAMNELGSVYEQGMVR